MNLPEFKYHPDPIATGSVIESHTVCRCCGQARGYIYTGPVYCTDELSDEICPWCIADGSAHENFDASYTDEAGIGGHGDWGAVPNDVVEEVAYRTPGFSGWQQEQWWTHCGDAAVFLGRMGYKELQARGPEAIAAIREALGFLAEKERETFLTALHKDGSPTAYLFRCTRCGLLGGYQDSH